MKLTTLSLLALGASAVSARFVEKHEIEQVAINGHLDAEELYTIELAPGEVKKVTEDEKWELRRQGINFMDISETADLGTTMNILKHKDPRFPTNATQHKALKPLMKDLSKSNMRAHLTTFTAFHTRYYKSDYGAQSAAWLYKQVTDLVEKSGATKNGASVRQFTHPWGQHSVIASIPGKSNKTVVIGAHQDSINLFLPSFLAAPGADDDGSGTVTILEALRVLLTDEKVIKGEAENTVEFHWYSAEEGGLLGSQAIFQSYEKEGRDVKAMLQQDMTGYIAKTIEAGEPESVGVITDFVNPQLTDFVKVVIENYCQIPWVETKCGYACSDHASASKAGYPSAFVIESDFKYSDTKIHTTEDKIEFLSFDHMLQHAKLTLGVVYELAFADL